MTNPIPHPDLDPNLWGVCAQRYEPDPILVCVCGGRGGVGGGPQGYTLGVCHREYE